MRKTAVVSAILVLAWLAYQAWPVVALYDLGRATRAGDAAAIAQRVDFPALQRSLGGQILATYARLSGNRIDRGFAGTVAPNLFDPLVARLISPETLTELLRAGWPRAILAEPPPDFEAPGLNALGSIWQLYGAADYGIGEFRIGLPPAAPAERQFRLHLALSRWSWKLAAVDLPVELQERLARELMKQSANKPPAVPR